MKALNGLVLLTSRRLEQAQQAELLKQRAMSIPSTAAAFIGASNRSVKVLVSVKRANGAMPDDEASALAFHQEAYRQVFEPYNALMDNALERRTATLQDRFCMTYDAHPLLNSQAVAFLVNEGLPAAIVAKAQQKYAPQQTQSRPAPVAPTTQQPGSTTFSVTGSAGT